MLLQLKYYRILSCLLWIIMDLYKMIKIPTWERFSSKENIHIWNKINIFFFKYSIKYVFYTYVHYLFGLFQKLFHYFMQIHFHVLVESIADRCQYCTSTRLVLSTTLVFVPMTFAFCIKKNIGVGLWCRNEK